MQKVLQEAYQEILQYLELNEEDESASWNMWLTNKMMMVAQRKEPTVRGEGDAKIDINTLGFAGTMAVKNEASLTFLKELTPIGVL